MDWEQVVRSEVDAAEEDALVKIPDLRTIRGGGTSFLLAPPKQYPAVSGK